jgi:hypothetical protein
MLLQLSAGLLLCVLHRSQGTQWFNRFKTSRRATGTSDGLGAESRVGARHAFHPVAPVVPRSHCD